jgi:hypothetical protein
MLDLRKKGLLLATGQFELENDGRIKLVPCSIAWFDLKTKDQPKTLLTVRSSFAYLTLNRPITSLGELADRQILAIEFANGLRLAGPQEGKEN